MVRSYHHWLRVGGYEMSLFLRSVDLPHATQLLLLLLLQRKLFVFELLLYL
jgi:hypothetical protein